MKKLKLLIILIIIFFLGVIGTCLSFECETKNKICINNYDYDGNCCELLNPIYHHCLLNSTTCRSRKLSETYFDSNKGLYYGLLIDSNDPSNWYLLKPENRKSFQDCVNNNIMSGQEYWICSYDFEDIDGIIRHLYLDQGLIIKKIIVEPIINETINKSEVITIEVEEKSFFSKIIDWFKNLF